MLQRSNDALTGTWKTRSLGLWQEQRSPKRQIGGILSIPQRSPKPHCTGNFCTEVLWRRSRVSPPQDSWLERKISSNEVLLKNKRRSSCLIWSSREKPLWRERLLFVHQEPWQQRMLERCGSQLVLMDATYKTTMYAIPLWGFNHKKLSQSIALLRKIRVYLPLRQRLLYYNSIIHPIIRYVSVIWSCCDKESLNRVLKLQKKGG